MLATFRFALGALATASCGMAAAGSGADAAVASARAALVHSLHERHGGLQIAVQPEIDTTTAAELAAVPSWRVRSVDSALRRRMTVLMEPAGGSGRASRITFVVDAKATGWKLLHAGSPGAALRADDVAPTSEDALAVPGIATPRDIAQWRLVRALPEGHVLRNHDLADARAVLRGDAVGVRYELGVVSLEAKGIALSAGKPGEVVKVSLPGRRETVEGVVGDARQIIVKP